MNTSIWVHDAAQNCAGQACLLRQQSEPSMFATTAAHDTLDIAMDGAVDTRDLL